MARKLLFIHGTGVRNAGFAATMTLLQRKVAQHLPGWQLHGCNWGDAFGARLNMGGASVPGYDASGNAAPALEAAAQARWVLLASDPLIELRVAPEETVLGAKPGPLLWTGLKALLQPPKAVAVLQAYGVADEWRPFHAGLVNDQAWEGTVSALTLKGPAVNDKIARALAAAFQVHLRENALPGLTRAGRDALVDALLADLGGAGLGLKDWFLRQVTSFMQPRRGKMTDATGPAVGDILRYQARGETLRAFIGEEVKRSGADVLLAHSLGGIAAVDFLAQAPRDVGALVTVGSQAAYFYEIDALHSRPFGSGLPDYFPKRWLNVYDEHDFLSYRGADVFPGRVVDARADNGQPFPDSHSAYWHNDADLWQPLAAFLR
jgi:hypothetical protein